MARLPQRIQLAHESLERIAPRDEFPPDSPHLLGVRLGLAGLAIDFFPDGRWFALETSCPQTPPTAIESAEAETLPNCRCRGL
jgi:hypothetical protein